MHTGREGEKEKGEGAINIACVCRKSNIHNSTQLVIASGPLPLPWKKSFRQTNSNRLHVL